MQDSNLRPLGPKPSALPSCANHRFMLFQQVINHLVSTDADITELLSLSQTFFIKKMPFGRF